MINCIIIEDQPPAQRILKNYISEYNNLNLVATLQDAFKAKTLLDTEKIDLIFLDIHLPKISGIDFLRSIPNHPKVILTTAFSEYAIESYEFNVVDYLLKPISKERFHQALLKLNVSLANENENFVFIKSGYDHIKLNTSEIIYIKSDADYTEVFTAEKVYLSKDSLKQWLQKLITNNFSQIHKSYLINPKHLERVSGNIAYLKNTPLPIGRAYKKSFIENHLK